MTPDHDDREFRILNEQTQQEVASIASRGLRGETLSAEEIRRVCGTALHHARRCYNPNRSTRELMDLAAATGAELGLPEDGQP